MCNEMSVVTKLLFIVLFAMEVIHVLVILFHTKRHTKRHTLKMYADSTVKSYYFNENWTVKSGSTGSVGVDLFIKESLTITPGETVKLPLGVYCEPIDNLAYDLRCRSSIYKTSLRLCNGVGTIDANYRGELCACVDNIGTESITVRRGERLFQLVFGDGHPIDIVPVRYLTDLSDTERGENGFGSTGN